MHRIISLVLVLVASLSFAACTSNADKASENLSKEAEKFNVQRKIVAINGITDKPILDVEGRCSIENESIGLVVICKHGPDDYRKHFVGLSDNVTFVSTQLKGIDVSEYRTKFILRPEALVPDIDLVTGDQP
jgi:hypothetical protein